MVSSAKKQPDISLHTPLKPAQCPKPALLEHKWPLLIILPILLVLVSFSMGKFKISVPDLLHTVYYHFADVSQIKNPNMETVLFNIRIPRILTAVLVGGGLSIAGAAYQGMFRNPMVSPDIMGASAGAALGASIALLLGFTAIYVQLFAFIGGVAAVFLAMAAARSLSRDALMGLVLAGMMVSTLMQSGSSAVKLLADGKDKLPAITFWLMGSFASIDSQDFRTLLPPVLIGFLILIAVRWQLNVLSFGEEEARSLGVKTRHIRALVIVASTLITAACVSVSGMIGWVGLVIPHLARAVVGPNYRQLLPTCFILGCSYLLLVDNIPSSQLRFLLEFLPLLSVCPFSCLYLKKTERAGIQNNTVMKGTMPCFKLILLFPGMEVPILFRMFHSMLPQTNLYASLGQTGAERVPCSRLFWGSYSREAERFCFTEGIFIK